MQKANNMEKVFIEARSDNWLGNCFGCGNKDVQKEGNFLLGYHISQHE